VALQKLKAKDELVAQRRRINNRANEPRASCALSRNLSAVNSRFDIARM
jgi:hypothetical protein